MAEGILQEEGPALVGNCAATGNEIGDITDCLESWLEDKNNPIAIMLRDVKRWPESRFSVSIRELPEVPE